jgi:phosphoribosylamine--glycine ligase
MASAGYPGSYAKGKEVKDLDQIKGNPGHMVFQAGTTLIGDKIVTSGGRVLIAVALGNDLVVAAARALKAVQTINFVGAQFRSDVARKGISR